jgi:transcriptional regulator NrdR family protein
MNCPFCASANVRRSRRRGITERVSCWMGRRPYRCHTCMHRFFSSEAYRPQPQSKSEPQVIEGTIVDSR